MAVTDYEQSYATLQLAFGTGLKEVNERWRKLSRIHHPDRHMRDPNAYRQALEKQKQLNNARDILKSWFEANPNSPPPRAQRSSTQNNAQNNSSGAKTTGGHTGSHSQSTNNRSQQRSHQSNHGNQHQTHSHYHWDHARQSQNSTASGSTSDAATGWFKTTELNLTPLQQWVKRLDAYCNRPNSDSATALAMALGFVAVFGPLWIITAIIGAIFPELPGHYPDWLTPCLLFGSGYITTYLFRWYFAESEIIKLQEQTRYFRTERTVHNSIEFLKLTIQKQARPDAQWRFQSNGTSQEAVLDFEEELLPDMKRPRKILLRFAVKDSTIGRIVGLEVRTTSPINSFACKKIAESVLVELKKDFYEVAA